MSIARVRVQINGTWTTLTSSDGVTWSGTITAPSITSHNLTGGYYPVTVEATNDVGSTTTVDASDASLGSNCKLTVKETVKPVILLTSPSSGAYSANNKQPITFTVTDEAAGSGVNTSTVVLKIDDTAYTESSEGMEKTAITNGYKFVYTPQEAMGDGSHSIVVDADDYDGNSATTVSSSFTIDTVPPTLNISTPAADTRTASTACVINGVTNDSKSSPVTLSITNNGTDAGTVTIASDGSFSKTVTLALGTNTITVVAKDSAGQTSSVSRTVTLDTSVPTIKSIELTPNPASTSSSISITIEVN